MAIPARLGNRPSDTECRNPERAIQASTRMNPWIVLTIGWPEAFNCSNPTGTAPPASRSLSSGALARTGGWRHEAISPTKNSLLLTAQALDEVIELFKGSIGDSQFTACGSFVENLSFQAQAAGQT